MANSLCMWVDSPPPNHEGAAKACDIKRGATSKDESENVMMVVREGMSEFDNE